MPELVELTTEHGDVVRCPSLADATLKAGQLPASVGRILVELIPEGGGPVTTLRYDRTLSDWTPA